MNIFNIIIDIQDILTDGLFKQMLSDEISKILKYQFYENLRLKIYNYVLYHTFCKPMFRFASIIDCEMALLLNNNGYNTQHSEEGIPQYDITPLYNVEFTNDDQEIIIFGNY